MVPSLLVYSCTYSFAKLFDQSHGLALQTPLKPDTKRSQDAIIQLRHSGAEEKLIQWHLQRKKFYKHF
jgi:hypothetical protein